MSSSDVQPHLENEAITLTRTERRQQQTHENLIKAVRKLTASKGVESLTIRDIAEEADIAIGGFYNHFESKDELLRKAAEEIAFQSGEIIDGINAASDDPLEIIATAFTMFDGMIQADPILGWFAVRVTAHDPEWADSLFQRFTRDVNKGVASRKFNVPNVPLAIDAVGASFINFFRSRLLGHTNDTDVPDFVHLMLRMLGAKEATAKETAARIWEKFNTESEEK